MAIPTYNQFIEPILRYLAAHPEGGRARDVSDAAADALGVSEEERKELLQSGAYTYRNRAAWAVVRLKQAKLLESARKGHWVLTPEGRKLAEEFPEGLPPEEIKRLSLPGTRSVVPQSTEESQGQEDSTFDSVGALNKRTPEERLREAVEEIRESVAADILEILAQVDPVRFEHIVLDVLYAMGYGTSSDDIYHTGRSGDGGIDGVISLDRLGLDRVYIQAKRWQHSVGRPEVQGFYGALMGMQAKRGVIITTSGFTRDAQEFARNIEGVVLVDGERLAELMIDHGVGVSVRKVMLPAIDRDYFDID